MEGNGLIIRLIDVVMIILLGFLNISDFGNKAQIKLDSASSEEQPNQTMMYFVVVTPSGAFIVTNSDNDEKIMFAQTGADSTAHLPIAATDAVNTQNPEISNPNLAKLEIFLNKRFEENSQNQINTLVVIKSHPETKIQYAIDVLDLCEKNEIPRTISY
jgi:biopolymer transport protein ExbD